MTKAPSAAATAAPAAVAPTVTVKVQQPVDPARGRSGASVVEDCSVMLICTNAGPSQNKLHRMKVLGAHAPHDEVQAACLLACAQPPLQRLRDIPRVQFDGPSSDDLLPVLQRCHLWLSVSCAAKQREPDSFSP